jgi:hypothetical protein
VAFRECFAQKPPPDYKRELLNVRGEDDMVVIYARQTWTSADREALLVDGVIQSGGPVSNACSI